MRASRILPVVALTSLLLISRSYAEPSIRHAESVEAVQPLGVGDAAPDAPLTTLEGKTVRLHDLLKGKHTILVFFRGGWCPYCNAHLAGLRHVHENLKDMEYQLIAVSPDSLESVTDMAAKQDLDYGLFDDSEMKAISSFGLAFKLSDETLERYKKYGISLRSVPGTDDKVLPVPAVYLVDPAGVIQFAYYNPDYKKRLDPHAVVAAARTAKRAETPADIRTRRIEYMDGDTALVGYLALPPHTDGPIPGVVVFHEWWGLNDYAQRRARQLAAMGYAALAADMYGDGTVVNTPESAGRLAGMVRNNRILMRRRAQAALESLSKEPEVDAERLAAIGYCFGGTCALELARSGADVRGVVSFHGGLDRSDVPDKEINARILVCNGADDPHVSEKNIADFKEEMKEGDVDMVFISYSDAVHAFTNPRSGSRPSTGVAYSPLADLRSWEHMKDFFQEILGDL